MSFTLDDITSGDFASDGVAHGSDAAERGRSHGRSMRHARTSGGRPPRARRTALQVIIQVIGELFITVGIILLLFVAWQLWWTNIEADATQHKAVNSLVQKFAPVIPKDSGPVDDTKDYGEPVVGPMPPPETQFGVLMIPRFGKDYNRPISTGVSTDILNRYGVGHYPKTQMPGAVGNFAVAGHRQTYGQVFDQVHELVPGDKFYVWTQDGYYTYVFRNEQIVSPNRVDVLDPVPAMPGAAPEQRYMTLTTCNPRFGSQERFIAYATLESWRPASAPPPGAVSGLVKQLSETSKG